MRIYNIMYKNNFFTGGFMQNIVILTMSLNIGGAETHIYELACALKEKGNDVTVFSAGGVYADKLEEKGVRHVTAPFNSKSPSSLKKCYKILCDHIKKYGPCVIHSHTRISNFTAKKVAKKFNIPFVSTVHFNFSTGFIQKLMTNWGDRAIAVSEDLKAYTVDNYGFDPNKVSVTVNGINLGTFCKRTTPEFKRELGLEDDAKVILCVSRLDEVAGDHVYRVLTMSETIYKNNPDANIVIVGGGTRFEEFKEIASNVNNKTKDGFIRLLGPQTDIYRYCNIADLFIGISRSALEAMACEVPTVLLGNSGYLGLFSKETEPMCIETNFTCRNCPYPDDSVITNLVHDMLSNPGRYEENIKAGLEIVKNRYSVLKMANDALDAYEKAWCDKRPYGFMICGYYGRSNLGDDMSLKAIADNAVKVSGVDKMVLLTSDAKYNPHCNIEVSIHRFNLLKIFKYMKKTRAFLLGSGSILQDATSSRSIFYYLYIMKQAKNHYCKVMLYSNGVGPINRDKNRRKAVELLEKADIITVRDPRSAEYLRTLGVTNQNIELTADETFTLDTKEITDKSFLKGDGRYLCVNLRDKCMTDEFIASFSEFLNDVSVKHGFIPVLLPVHYDQDIQTLKKISEFLSAEHILINQKLTHAQTLGVIDSCEITITERLHAAIFSCIYGKPFLAVNYDPKVKSLCIDMDMEDCMIGLTTFDKETVTKQFEKLIEEKEQIKEQLSAKVEEKKALAIKNAVLARELIK